MYVASSQELWLPDEPEFQSFSVQSFSSYGNLRKSFNFLDFSFLAKEKKKKSGSRNWYFFIEIDNILLVTGEQYDSIRVYM